MSTYRPSDIIDNRYLIEAHLGSGGFADVFKAKDEMTGATIAIKIYNSMDASGVAIFQKEYLKMSDVHHSRLLTAHHFGVYESSPYLIMPLCKLGNLTRLLIDEDNFLSEEKLATVLLQVSEGLEYLHRKGIVHQDIKPDNILEKEKEEYVLSDFGISQRARSTLQKSIRRTDKMGSKGSGYTPAYAPPTRERLSTRAVPSKDIFSLGATLYELSAKELPYTDMGEAVQNHLEIPDVEHGYSPGWNQLLQSCLALEPEARPTATELKQMAQQFLAQGVWVLPEKGKVYLQPASSEPSRKAKSATPVAPPKEKKLAGSKRGWLLALLAIPVVAGLGWGVYQKIGSGGGSPQGPETVTDRVSTTTPIEEDPIATAPSDTPATLANPPAEETAAEPNQKQYDDIIASAERNYRRGNYEISLGKFESAKGLVSDDQAAIDGIAKCEQKIADLDEERQRQAAEEETERKRRAAASYRTIRLNGQTWLAQNLNYDTGSGSWCYDNDPANCRKYGRLYTWAAAKKACAALGSGWRLPTDREWRSLANAYGGYYDWETEKDVGDPKRSYKALLDGGSSGFKALLGGYRGSGGSFYGLGAHGVYWCGTEGDAQGAWGYGFVRLSGKLIRRDGLESFGRSCRCVKD